MSTRAKAIEGALRPEMRKSMYGTWRSMISRCNDRTNPQYKNYGGRGIAVCERWQQLFSDFVSDMGTRPSGLTIDRINNDGNYEPSRTYSTKIAPPVQGGRI